MARWSRVGFGEVGWGMAWNYRYSPKIMQQIESKITKKGTEYHVWYLHTGRFFSRRTWKQVPMIFLDWEHAIAQVKKNLISGHKQNKIIKIERTEFSLPLTER